jgi:hypothetical protein
MSKWYGRVIRDPDNHDIVLEACDHFEGLYEEARNDLKTSGARIEKLAADLPGLTEYRWGQLQEIEAILSFLETRENKAKAEKMRHYLEHYDRTLSDRTAEKYADAHDEVQTIRIVRQQVAHVRNLFMGILKKFEALNYQLTNITKLRAAGIEDATL